MLKENYITPLIKRLLFLSGLLLENQVPGYSKKTTCYGAKAEKLIVSKKLFLDPQLTLTKLAREVGTNRTYLSGFFSNEKRCSFSSYINNLRADYAYKLLSSDGNYPLSDIALMSGFGSLRSLNRAFYKMYGVLPSRMRRSRFTSV